VELRDCKNPTQEKLRKLRDEMIEALKNQDFEKAAELRAQQTPLSEKVMRAASARSRRIAQKEKAKLQKTLDEYAASLKDLQRRMECLENSLLKDIP
jgi:excinuclease UvrABC nuclease subunit